ncbi:helix-turn-helix domain-containing protein [Ottowia sp.]
MGTRYEQLQPEERMTLASLHQQGWSIRAIAKIQGRSTACARSWPCCGA